MLKAGVLAKRLNLSDEATVRQSINRTRGYLGKKFASAGFETEDGKTLIENSPWQGYRLRPDRVRIRVITEDKVTR